MEYLLLALAAFSWKIIFKLVKSRGDWQRGLWWTLVIFLMVALLGLLACLGVGSKMLFVPLLLGNYLGENYGLDFFEMMASKFSPPGNLIRKTT